MTLQHDDSGFLVGQTIKEIKRSSKNSTAILSEVKKIASLLKQQGHLRANNSSNSERNNTQANAQHNEQMPPSNAGNSGNNNNTINQQNSSNSDRPQSNNSNTNSGNNAQNQSSNIINAGQQLANQLINNAAQQSNANANESTAENTRRERARDANGRFISDSGQGVINAGDDGSSQHSRDSRGRFSGGGAGGSGSSRTSLDKDGDSNGNGLKGLFDGLGDRISSVMNAGQDLEEADPTVKAMREMAEPLQKGYQFIFGDNAKKDKPYFAWFKKIWETLKKTEKNTSEHEESTGGIGGFIGSILPFIMGAVGLIFGPVALGIGTAAIAAWGIFTKQGREFFANFGTNIVAAWQWSVDAFSQNVIPALVASWGFAVGVFNDTIAPAITSGWNWFTQQATDTWNGLTTWLSTDLPQIMSDTWDSIKSYLGDQWDDALKSVKPVFDSIGKTWDSFIESAKGGWDTVIGTFTSLYNSLKELPVIGDAIKATEEAAKLAKEAAENAKQAISNNVIEPVANAAGMAKSGYEKTVDWVSRKGESAVNTVKDAHAKAVDWTSRNVVEPVANNVKDRWNDAKPRFQKAADVAGVDAGTLARIANFESSGFNANAAPIDKNSARNTQTLFDGRKALSTAHGYGQFLDGTWKDYINKYGDKYGIDTGGGKLTKAEANKFRDNKDIQAAMLAEFTKENVETGRKLGGSDDNANVYALHNLGGGDGRKFLKALKKNPNAPVSSILSGDVISKNSSLYGDGSISVAKAYGNMGNSMARGDVFANDLKSKPVLATPQQTEQAMPKPMNGQVAVASIKSSTNPAMPNISVKQAKVPEMPKLELPLTTNGGSTQSTFVSDIGQDISDPRLAHIASPYGSGVSVK